MNATICSLLFFLSSLLLLASVGAAPSLPTRVPLSNLNNNDVSSLNSVPPSSPNTKGNNNNNNDHFNHRQRSISEPNPSTGNQRLLVLTVQFPDRAGSGYTGSEWKSGTFGEFVTFFKDQSYNQLQYEVDVVTIDTNGAPVINSNTANQYIPLPSNVTQYANGHHGWSFSSSYSLHTIVRDAAIYLDIHNFDWAPYSVDNKVVNVVVMSAGHDFRYAEGVVDNASSLYLLSTSFSGSHYVTSNGAVLNSYTFCNEHTQRLDSSEPLGMARLGQCAHEFVHSLGVPDLYDMSAQSTGVGYFDLMGYGLYANVDDGSKPVGLSAWSKLQLGWIQPRVITSAQQVQLGPCSVSSTNFLQIYPNASSSSYLLVESRQSVDTWDKNFASQLSNGIIIWQVNPEAVSQYKFWNTINTHASPRVTFPTPSSPSMVVREADGGQHMNTPSSSGVLNYGASTDLWQAGRSYTVAGTNFRIVVVGLSDKTFSLSVVYPSLSTPGPTPTPSLPNVPRPPTTSPTRPSPPPTTSPTPPSSTPPRA